MNPDDGPTESDTNGKGGKGAPSGGNIAIAQLTVATGKSFDAKVNCQGHDTKGVGSPGPISHAHVCGRSVCTCIHAETDMTTARVKFSAACM